MVCFRFRSLRTGTAVKILSFSVLLWVIDFLLTAHLESQLASIEAEVTEQYDIEKASENSAGITSHEIKRLQDELRTINGHIDDRRLVNAVQVKTSKWMGTEDVPVSKSALGVYNNAYVQSFKKNHVVTSGLCTSRPISGNTLPKFIFVAGVEGSGHHALKDVWWALEASGLKLKLIVYDQIFHSLGIENHASFHYSSISKETYQEHMAPTFSQAAADGAIVIDAQNSYPMGMGAGSLAHPDLVMLSELDGKLFDLRVIVIYRDPVAATLSAVRRFQDSDEYMYKNYEFQARFGPIQPNPFPESKINSSVSS